jgi:hypothetical protein
MRLLVKELHVMSPDEILPTHRGPPVVRAPNGQVELKGFEPGASEAVSGMSPERQRCVRNVLSEVSPVRTDTDQLCDRQKPDREPTPPPWVRANTKSRQSYTENLAIFDSFSPFVWRMVERRELRVVLPTEAPDLSGHAARIVLEILLVAAAEARMSASEGRLPLGMDVRTAHG